jgi:hypothetical protein
MKEILNIKSQSDIVKNIDQPDSTKDSGFTEEKRASLTDSFIALLKEEKEKVVPDVELIRGVVSDTQIEKNRGLMIFSRAMQRLIQNPDFPAKEKIIIQVALFDLSPRTAGTIDGVNLYPTSVGSVLEVLDRVLTPEVSLALHSYAKKIFVDPLK